MTGPIAGLTAALADRYRIERELGAGGMATVYLAQDLKHNRKVAIKVLRPELAAVIGAGRFLREIQTIATLQHPHILGLIDSGEVNGTAYYVMPFVEGESLRDRLNREKQLPIADATRIATEVAGALDYAHRRGVIHRDIKPENIMLHDGSALVADFGIALAVSSAGGSRMTETGMSLGTPHYMSPEQAMGEREITARSDVYALGAMTYEMLVGDPPFIGSTAQAIVAKVLTEKPQPLSRVRETVPEHVEDAVLTALAKLPADRWPSAAAFAAALDGQTMGGPTASRTARRPLPKSAETVGTWRSRVPWLAALAVAGIVAALGWLRPARPPEVSRYNIILWGTNLPHPLDPGASVVATQAAIAPDGSGIVYADRGPRGLQLMWKPRAAAEATPIDGTEGGLSPSVSPDGRWIVYQTTDGRVRKVPLGGGGAVTLATGADGEYKVTAWLDDGTIVYTDRRRFLSRIPSDAVNQQGTPLRQHSTAGATSIGPLPGSHGVLFTLCFGNCAIQSDLYVYDFAADSARLLVRQAAGGWYSPTGHLLYTSRDGGLYAAEFDPDELTIGSGSVPVIEHVDPSRFTLSPSGSILYALDPVLQSSSDLVWVSRDGRTEPVDSTWRGRFEYPALSPDGTSLAVSLRGKITDLWIRQADGTRQKVIAGGIANWRASWLPDGKSLNFVSVLSSDTSSNDNAIYHISADGSGRAQLLFRHPFAVWEAEVSRDGRWMVVRTDEEAGRNKLYARRMDGDTTLIPLVDDKFTGLYAVQAALSPDARWIAFISDESGTIEVYVASFPDMGSRRMVSRGGGTEPRWSRDGRELFFKSGGQLMAMPVSPGPRFAPGNPRPLFSLAGFRAARNRPQYDVAPDGRFVMIREPSTSAGLVYVENWFDELKQKVRR
jgi:eukaryotic-like serine/threonine-protein kinase